MIKTKIRMLKEEIIKFQPKVWTQCSVTNTFTTHNCSIRQSLEEIWRERSQWVLQQVLRDLSHLWVLPMLAKQWAKTSIQPSTGNQPIRETLKQQHKEIKSNHEDLFGPSTDRLIAHLEDNTRRNLLILMETMVTTQETFCLMMLQNRKIETLSSQLVPLKWPTIFQATMVSYPTLILIKMPLSNQKASRQEKLLSSKILLKISRLNFLATKDTKLWAL